MSCEPWVTKLDAYLDGELPSAEARAVYEHVRGCGACAAQVLSKVQLKRAIQSAGNRYAPDPAFRDRIQSMAARHLSARSRPWLLALAGSAAFGIILAVALLVGRRGGTNSQFVSELADLHVATLASSNPVDVVSTDRHTVKPWFEGKIPFTFNLPELEGSPFTLVGGKVSYVRQSPGAELIFRVRQHQISVFIFQQQAGENARALDELKNAESFGVRSWSHNGLRYFVVGDVSGQDLERLRELIRAAG
jgi:anti-sigma factor RsiW